MANLFKTQQPKTFATRDLGDEEVQRNARLQGERVRTIRGETLMTAGAIPTPGVPRRQLIGV